MKSGQALVMVLLVLGIAITIGLSVVSRSVTDVSVSTTQDESAKALEAAEAGAERALGGVLSPNSTPVPGAVGIAGDKYQVQSKPLTIDSTSIYETIPVDAGDVVSLDLVGYSGTQVCVFWNSPAGVETMAYYQTPTAMAVLRGAYGGTGTNFTSENNGCGTSARFSNSQLLGLPTNPRLLRVRLVSNATTSMPIGFSPRGGTFPSQGQEIFSTGQSGSVTQKVRVIQPDADTPMMFDAALFSGSDLVQ